ncbi:MAG TPA: Rieske (2Fe-2S) protein [Rudaea sp.]|nr:Rieske (2Fe-2S) protein [Rudaea sp.]
MDRRRFVKFCAGTALTAGLAEVPRVFASQIADFAPAALLKEDGSPLKASEIGAAEAMVFAYPYKGVPCFLINLGDKAPRTQPLISPDGDAYTNPQGVGRRRNLVAFVAICTHQLSYPSPQSSVLRYAAAGSELAGDPGRIVCCAHGSVYDPADGARKVSGPAPGPLLPVRLAYDPASDGLTATGSVDEKFFRRFFDAYKSEMIERFGPGVYRQEVGPTTRAVLLSRYSRLVAAC